MKYNIKKVCRNLRRNQTATEKIMWIELKNRKLLNKKFNRQYPIKFQYHDEYRFFVLDFYCAKHKLGIEIDGKIHDNQKEHDTFRETIINTLGIKIIRFTNDEVLNSKFTVLTTIKSNLSSSPSFKKERGLGG